jgi:iron complex outermembrane receptor protein
LRVSLQDQNRNNRVYNTRPTGTQELEGYHDAAGRVQLQYKDTDFTALAGIHGRQLSGNATLFRANIIKPGTNDLVDGFRYKDYPTDGINTQTEKTYGANLRLRWDLPGVSLYSITGYDRGEIFSRADVDGGYGCNYPRASFFCPAVTPPTGPGFLFNSETADGIPSLKQFTQEFRVQSNTKDPLQWLGSLYFFKEDLQVGSFNFDSLNGSVQNGYAVQHQDSKSYAAFGSINYAVTDALKIRGGVRYTKDKKDFDAQRLVGPFGTTTPLLTANPKGNNTSWDFGANYTIDKDTSVYGRVATGYRAPSIQGRVLFGDGISVADSERSISYEVGIKQDLFDNKARFTATVFHFDTKDLQLTAGSGLVNQNQLVNAKKAVGQGVEVEIQANLDRNFKATLGASYNDTEIKDKNLYVFTCGSGCTVNNKAAGPVAGTVFINGNDLPRAPKVVGNFSLRYNQQIGEGEIYAYTDWSYKGSYNFFLYKATEYKANPLLEGGLRVGYKWGDGQYEIAGYGRNITDKRKVVAAIDFDNLAGILNEPRAYGVQFKYNF